MPTYEYACKSCGRHHEVVQSFSDEPLTECPECGGRLRKVFGNIGIAFKGSGFYRNDSRGSAKTPAKTPEPAGGGSGESSSAGGGEAAPSSGDGGAAKPATTETAKAPKPDKPAKAASA